MEKKELIESGRFKELSLAVFNQKIDSSSEGVYTDILNEDEELAVAEKMLQENKEAGAFLYRYLEHYSLANKVVDLLIDNIADNTARKLLLKNFELYGYSLEQGYKSLAEEIDADFLYKFCLSARIFYKELYDRLSLICPEGYKEISEKMKLPCDGNWGEVYLKAVKKYRS